jgi:glycosyltransferase involved in cell wall biosynthesis
MGFRVSVVVPVFNRARLINRCLESILDNPREDLEVLAIDDGSEDGSLEVMTEYEKRYPDTIRVLMHPGHENRGVSESRNLGILASTGDYISFLDSDDTMLPGRFAYALRILDRFPDIEGVYEAGEILLEDGGQTIFPACRAEIPFDLLDKQECEPPWLIQVAGITVRRTLFQMCGLFDSRMWVGEDIHMWLRMLMVGRLVPGTMQKPVFRHYRHAGNTAGFDAPQVELSTIASVYKWACKRPVPPTRLEFLERTYMSLFCFYLTQARAERLGLMREFSLLCRALVHFPRFLLTRQYLGNLYGLLH